MIEKITYTDKERLTDNPSVADKNKVTDVDMNEIKSVVNNNADELTGIEEELDDSFETLQTENAQLKATLPTTTGTGSNVTLDKTAELEFIQPPLPRGNSEQDGEPSPTNEVSITNVTGDVEELVENRNFIPSSPDRWIQGSISASTGVNITATNRLRTRQYYKVTPLTDYYISVQNTEYEFMNIICYNKSKEYVAGYSNIDYSIVGSIGLAVNLPINTAYIRVVVRKHGNPDIEPSEIATIKPMMELGTTPTTFEEHQEQTFTFPLGSQRMYLGDYLADDGIHHPIRGQITLDGTENFENWTSGTNTIGFKLASVNNLKSITSSTTQFILLSNYFTASTSQNALANNDIEGIATTNGNLYFRINKTTASNLADFKTWLSTNNVTVEYELATEEITPYTTEQQAAYDEIKQAISYEEQTNILGSSSESNPIFDVEAYQSIKLLLQN